MNNLAIFDNQEFGQIRVFEVKGQPWFVGNDIASVLKYNEPHKAITRHVDEEDRIKHPIPTNGGNQLTWFINESGLYSLILSSKLTSAKKFKKWVTSEVLPSIHKHGAYMTGNAIEKALTDPDFLIRLATNLKEEKAKRIEAEYQVKKMQPAVNFARQIAKSQNTMLVREVAKLASKQGIKIGQNRLYDKLREWGLILKKGTEPDQRYVDRGYFEIAEGTKETSKGVFTHRTTMVTGKGQAYIINRLLEEKASAKKDREVFN